MLSIQVASSFQGNCTCYNAPLNGNITQAEDFWKDTVKPVVGGGNKADKGRGGKAIRQYQGMDGAGVRQVPKGSGEQGEDWRKLVAKSSVVPHCNSWLRH